MGGGTSRKWPAMLCGMALLALTAPAAAQASADDLARKHFESGVAYLQESDYPNALEAFEKAYELSQRPEILLNVATVHERSGKLQEAVDALERYLAAAPTGEHVETVKIRIANLKKRIEEAPPAPPEPSDTPPTTQPPPPPPVAPQPSPVAEQPPDRIPAYIALGVGGLAGVGAILTGVLAQNEYDDAESNCAPTCTDDEVSSGETLALTSTILTGVAIAGVSVGAVLWFTAKPSERQPTARTFDVQISGTRASAVWRF